MRYGRLARSSGSRKPRVLAGPVPGWPEAVAGEHATGPASASDTIVVFSDFQCPFCKRFALTLDSIKRAYPSVRIVERHYPLEDIHPEALEAALALECAGDAQRLESMRRVLFLRQDLVTNRSWGALAKLADVADTTELRSCVDSEQHLATVRRDVAVAGSIGVQGTPWIILNDSVFSAPPSFAELVRHFAKH